MNQRQTLGENVPHRRERSRLATQLPVQLTSLGSRQRGILLDLSLTGAQVFVSRISLTCEPPDLRGDMMLQWCNYEAFGRVIWQHRDTDGSWAGIKFDRVLTPSVVIGTRDQQDEISRQGGLEYLHRREVRDWVTGSESSQRF
ncbi:MAG: PilZ domain-containing protein [Sphingomonadaceae bacterium]|nr:PilZ domain-containing protein [Sphingomonadaceae bacterium]